MTRLEEPVRWLWHAPLYRERTGNSRRGDYTARIVPEPPRPPCATGGSRTFCGSARCRGAAAYSVARRRTGGSAHLQARGRRCAPDIQRRAAPLQLQARQMQDGADSPAPRRSTRGRKMDRGGNKHFAGPRTPAQLSRNMGGIAHQGERRMLGGPEHTDRHFSAMDPNADAGVDRVLLLPAMPGPAQNVLNRRVPRASASWIWVWRGSPTPNPANMSASASWKICPPHSSTAQVRMAKNSRSNGATSVGGSCSTSAS